MSSLTLRAVTKRFGAADVLHGIDLDVADGEFVVLVGPSGCGKSTLLRMIAGLEEISSGDLLIGGVRRNGTPPQRRDIAMVFQSYALFPHLTVRRNISFGLDLRRTAKAVVAEKVLAAATTLNLVDYLDRYPRQLSGGQRQRVAMARAIVREPALFLMDEPLSNLDAQLRVDLRAEMKALHARLGRTTVYVTHDQVEAMTLADKLVVMRGGRIEQAGAPLDLYAEPANLFVAGFLGSPAMNLLPALAEGGRISIAGSNRVMPWTGPQGALTLGARPEDCAIGDGGLPAVVRLVERMGSESVVHLTLNGMPFRLVTRARVTAVPGEELPVLLDLDKAHAFERDSGRRL